MLRKYFHVAQPPHGRFLSTIDEARWKSGKELFLSRVCLFLTLCACMLLGWEQYPILTQQLEQQAWLDLSAHLLFLMIVAFLVYGSLVYQATRMGYLRRLKQSGRFTEAGLSDTYRQAIHKPLTILVPSYKEERKVIFQTLLSAALQEHPNRRVVLLLDDPAQPKTAADAAQLADGRELPAHINALLSQPAFMFSSSIKTFNLRRQRGRMHVEAETRLLAALWHEAANWFETQAEAYPVSDHTDRLFVDKIFLQRAEKYRARREAVLATLAQHGALTAADIIADYDKIATLFSCEVSSFERKRYENLSHESNKAMNLNSYIGLTGKHFREERRADGLYLVEASASEATLAVAPAEYFITLDADSLILPDYALKLIHIMELPGNERIAVAQTPYSAIPGAPTELERVAAATTDMQYIIHQGFTQFNATYWVGANALLRARALEDIVTTEHERGHVVTRYIQDRTVIEDTESSVDLAVKNWTLYNHPERLAYSATPPDFGSLCIQRQRWANGGLIILPKLLGYLLKNPIAKMGEGLLRVHYLSSIAAVNIGLVIMLTFPFTAVVQTVWLPLTALPYFILYGRDLVLCGYKKLDLFKVYALNLLLIPVNLAGVFKSIQQGLSGKKIPFGRTPKVQGRTAAAPLYIISAYLLFAHWIFQASLDINDGHLGHAAFAAMNSMFLLYAIRTYIGFKESMHDLRASFSATNIKGLAVETRLDPAALEQAANQPPSSVSKRKYG